MPKCTGLVRLDNETKWNMYLCSIIEKINKKNKYLINKYSPHAFLYIA